MITHHKPAGIHPPFSGYSHGVEVPPGARFMFCAGQLGVAADGTIPDGAEDQAELCFANIAAILATAGMSLADLVRINTYLSHIDHRTPYMRVRDRLMPDPPPASTLIVVSGFSRPEFKLEIEAIAARADG